MSNKRKVCKHCREYFPAEGMIKVPVGTFCKFDHVTLWLAEKNRKEAEKKHKQQKRVKVESKKKDKARLRELRKRSAWYADLQILVNQYVKYRDTDKPCCTCGTTNPNIKYDAGHFHTRKARPDIRFELTNIHKQCSQQCNVFGAGMRNEFEKFIAEKYGPDHVEMLERVRPPLKEQFPNWQDVYAEIIRYRQLLRSVGVKPKI